jgi:hypothetical protein
MNKKFEEKKTFFVGVLKITDGKIRIRSSEVQIRGSRSVPKMSRIRKTASYTRTSSQLSDPYLVTFVE